MQYTCTLVAGITLLGGCASIRTGSDQGAKTNDASAVSDLALAVESAEPIDPVADSTTSDQPSLDGFDRSHWPTLVVRPVSGTVHHPPAYLGGQSQATLDEVELSELTIEGRTDLALSPAYEGSMWSQMFWEPFRVGGQILALPATLVTQSPFSHAASPVRGGSAAAASSPQRGGLGRGQGATGQPTSGAGRLDTGSGTGPGGVGSSGTGAVGGAR